MAVLSPSSGAVLDVATGGQVVALAADFGYVHDVSWSPDGELIAASRDAGGVEVHDAHTGQQMMVLPGHRAPVLALAWSPDWLWLATSSSDGTTKVWGLARGRRPGVDDADG